MSETNKMTSDSIARAPQLAVPHADAARRVVSRWLRAEIGDALYPVEAIFVDDIFAWHVSVWFSTAAQPLFTFVADVYVNAATGAFLGRPTRQELIERLSKIIGEESQ